MNVEKTIQTILEMQLRAEQRAELADKRMDRAEQRAELTDKRMDRADKRAELTDKRMDRADKRAELAGKRAELTDKRAELAGKRAELADKRLDRLEIQVKKTADMVRVGMKMIIELRQSTKELDYSIKALIHSQAITEEQLRKSDEKFERFLVEFRRGFRNGHS